MQFDRPSRDRSRQSRRGVIGFRRRLPARRELQKLRKNVDRWQQMASAVSESLVDHGFAVIENVLSQQEAEALRVQAQAAKLSPASIGGGLNSRALRGDLMGWFRAGDHGWDHLPCWLEAADGETPCDRVLRLWRFVPNTSLHCAGCAAVVDRCNREIPQLQEV